MNIEITTNPKEEDAKTISHGMIHFNQSKIPDLEPIEKEVRFFVFARHQNKEIIGGIRATCFWNTLHIELLWIKENQRGKGTGKSLICSAEDFAVEQGCEKVFVETTSWQAKPFYEKLGYTHIATLHDRPKGYASHYLTKSL